METQIDNIKLSGPHLVAYYLINSITMYRLVSAPVLLILALTGHLLLFRSLVCFSFLTDAVDGPLSRKYKVTSVFGSRLDSVADDVTVMVSTIAVWLIDRAFLESMWAIILTLVLLFGVQTVAALIAYKKVTSFHTYMAKLAAVAQAGFFAMFFFGWGNARFAFYFAGALTALELLEEILLIIVLPKWKSNVKGLYWVINSKK